MSKRNTTITYDQNGNEELYTGFIKIEGKAEKIVVESPVSCGYPAFVRKCDEAEAKYYPVLTLDFYFFRWLQILQENVEYYEILDYNSLYKESIQPYAGDCPFDSLTLDAVLQKITDRVELTPERMTRVQKMLSSFFQYYADCDKLTFNEKE